MALSQVRWAISDCVRASWSAGCLNRGTTVL